MLRARFSAASGVSARMFRQGASAVWGFDSVIGLSCGLLRRAITPATD